MLIGERVAMRPGLFAYSMLYPLTDNWLDDPTVSEVRKRAFSERFGRRLAGRAVRPEDDRDRPAFRLVETIESEFPRCQCPWVYESLLAIHGGQTRSLDQQHRSRLSAEEVLAISFEKGGSSVLADLHLVMDAPRPAEQRFAFGFGVLLQLLDDLQDVEDDLAAGHVTAFTRAAARGPLDDETARLARFVDAVLASGPFQSPAFADRLDLIRRNCLSLLVGTVALGERRFSRGFRRGLERQWPVSFRAHRRLRRRALRHWSRIAPTVRAAGNETRSAEFFAPQAPRDASQTP
jgi:hypothetical protein